jgi:hypothetical protein
MGRRTRRDARDPHATVVGGTGQRGRANTGRRPSAFVIRRGAAGHPSRATRGKYRMLSLRRRSHPRPRFRRLRPTDEPAARRGQRSKGNDSPGPPVLRPESERTAAARGGNERPARLNPRTTEPVVVEEIESNMSDAVARSDLGSTDCSLPLHFPARPTSKPNVRVNRRTNRPGCCAFRADTAIKASGGAPGLAPAGTPDYRPLGCGDLARIRESTFRT